MKVGRSLCQQRLAKVFFREQSLRLRYAPVYAQRIIEDADAGIGFGMIEGIAFILEDCRFAQYGKTMCKATRYEELPMVLRSQFHRHMLAKRRTSMPDIDRHVQHTALHHPHELLCV